MRAWISCLIPIALMGCLSALRGGDATAVIAAAVSDPMRPAEDRARDADRKPSEMMMFAGVEPGDVVVDFLPGGGYFTRIFSKIVGPEGKVYAASPPADARGGAPPVESIAASYGNITLIPLQSGGFAVPEPVDLLWTAQNYHDLYLERLQIDVPGANRRFFDALKPGGVFIVVDHVAKAGAPISVADSLHRIDPAIIRRDLEAAGFEFEGESDVLRNPRDPLDISVFDPAIRGKTDQVVYRFRKPL
jgi:predicted methyltransferase